MERPPSFEHKGSAASVRQSTRLGAEWDFGAAEEVTANQYRDWNEQFQIIMEDICCIEKWESLQDKLELNNSLLQLIQDFNSVAKMYGRIIILERFLSTAQEASQAHGPNWMDKKVVVKTIPPSSSFHGIAGGEKYFVNNILFKFAVDLHGLYGNSDHFAAKAAGLEVLGISAYFNTNTPGLHLPLVTLVNFLGYRLVAVSLIPIRSGSGPDSTLVYGSQDGGKTVKNSDSLFAELAKHTATKLGLRSHQVQGRLQNNPVVLHTAFDVEGHFGTDGRFYMLDLARALPSDPFNWRKAQKGQNHARLVNRFRPEFMEKYLNSSNKYLTPDSPHEVIIGKTDPDYKAMFADIKDAAKYLREDCVGHVVEASIYSFLSAMHRKSSSSSSSSSSLSVSTPDAPASPSSSSSPSFIYPSPFDEVDIPALFHGNGVNLRYLGQVFQYISTTNRNFLRDEQTFVPIAVLVAVEAVARAIKNFVNQHFRTQMQRLSMSVEAPYRILLLNELNVFFRYDDTLKARRETELNWNKIRTSLKETLGFIDDEQVDYCLALVRGKFNPSHAIGRGKNVKLQGSIFSASKVQSLLIRADVDLGATSLYLLFSRLVKIMNLEFSDVAVKQFLVSSPMLNLLHTKQGKFFPQEAAKPFSLADLTKIRVIMKGMKIGMNAQANFYHSQGILVEKRTGGKSTALHHYSLAESLYKKIISFHPQDVETRYNLCATKYRMMLLKWKSQNGKEVSFDITDPEVQSVLRELESLKAQAHTDPRLRNLMGKFYFRCKSFQKAEYHTLMAIECAPQSEEYLESYAEILKSSKLYMLAVIFKLRASVVGAIIKSTKQLILQHDIRNDSRENGFDAICSELESVKSTLRRSVSGNFSPIIEKIAFGMKDKQELIQQANKLIVEEQQKHQQEEGGDDQSEEREEPKKTGKLRKFRRKTTTFIHSQKE